MPRSFLVKRRRLSCEESISTADCGKNEFNNYFLWLTSTSPLFIIEPEESIALNRQCEGILESGQHQLLLEMDYRRSYTAKIKFEIFNFSILLHEKSV